MVETKLLPVLLSLKTEVPMQSVSLLPLHYRQPHFLLQNLLSKSSWCLSKSKFPVFAKCIHFTKKNRSNFWTKFSPNVFGKFLVSPSIEKHELAKVPRKSILQSSCPIFPIQRHSSVIFSKKNWGNLKKTQFIGWQFARFFQNFWWSEQVITNSITETRISIWIYKVNRQPLCSLLWRYHWTSK